MTPKNRTSLMTVHIVGIGSALGADQLGWLAVRQLDSAGFKQRYLPERVNLSMCRSPALLVTQYAAAQALILLDAYCADDPAGNVRRFSVAEPGRIQRPSSSHGFDLKQALSLRQVMEKSCPPVTIFGICAGDESCMTDTNAVDNILDKAYPVLEKNLDAEILKYLPQSSGVVCSTA